MRSKLTKLLLILTFCLLTSYQVAENRYFKSHLFSIKKIILENNTLEKQDIVLKELQILKGKNLIFISEKSLEEILTQFTFISSAKIKKIYPNILKVYLTGKKPIAILIKNKKKFFISDKGNIIEYNFFDIYKNLPTVFGESKEFFKLYQKLMEATFKVEEIKAYYYFEIGRWDIELRDKKILKLPVADYDSILVNFKQIINQADFKNYNIFDYRIKDQLILN